MGGIAGYAVGDITDCINNGDITTNTSCVGGIAGEINSGAERNISDLINTGNISGNSKVGGVIGSLIQSTNILGKWYKDSVKGSNPSYTWYNHNYCLTTVLTNLANEGVISATNAEAGGIIGYLYVVGTYSQVKLDYNHGGIHSSNSCTYNGDFAISGSNIKNIGEVRGASKIGEIFGNFSSDAPSTLTTCTVTGKITVNGEVKEGTYDVGANTNLTLSGREIYVAPSETLETDSETDSAQ